MLVTQVVEKFADRAARLGRDPLGRDTQGERQVPAEVGEFCRGAGFRRESFTPDRGRQQGDSITWRQHAERDTRGVIACRKPSQPVAACYHDQAAMVTR